MQSTVGRSSVKNSISNMRLEWLQAIGNQPHNPIHSKVMERLVPGKFDLKKNLQLVISHQKVVR